NYRIGCALGCQAAGARHTLRQRVSVIRHAATIPMSDHATSTPMPSRYASALPPATTPAPLSTTQPTSGCSTPDATKPPIFAIAIAIPADCGGLTSLAIAHVSVKPGTARPVSNAAITTAFALAGGSMIHSMPVALNATANAITSGRRTPSRSDNQPTSGAQTANAMSVNAVQRPAATGVRPCAWTRKGAAHSPMNVMYAPEMPTLTQNGGHVAGFAATCASARRQSTVMAPVLRATGVSRTKSHIASASISDRMPTVTNTLRHETIVISQASGAVAASAPAMPATLAAPTAVAKRCSW